MDTMQQEIGDSGALLGVNAYGYEDSNDTFTSSADIPWLQDNMSALAWEAWNADWRDVYILDSQGRLYATIDLNSRDLGYEPDYNELRDLILEAAAR